MQIDKDAQDDKSKQVRESEPIKQDEQALNDFIKQADRVFIYDGEQSALERLNKKRKAFGIKFYILIGIQLILSLIVGILGGGWISLICIVMLSLFCVFVMMPLKKLLYKYGYDEFKNKSKMSYYDYDDNGIIIASHSRLLYKIGNIIFAFLPLINFFVMIWSAVIYNSEVLIIYLEVLFIPAQIIMK